MNFIKPYMDHGQFTKLGSFELVGETLCRLGSTKKFPDSSWVFASFALGVTVPLFSKNLLPKELWWAFFIASIYVTVRWKIAALLLAFTMGGLHVTYAFSGQQNSVLPGIWQKVDVALQGRVVGLPKIEAGNYRFEFEIDAIEGDSGPRSLVGERVLLSCYRCPVKIETGQSWSWVLRLKKPRGYSSSGAFDYEKFLFRNRIVATGYVRTKEKYSVGASNDDDLRVRINRFRANFRNRIDSLIPNSSAGNHFIKALVIGDKSAFTIEERDVLQKAGLSHLVAISGLHVGLMFFCTAWLIGCLSNQFPMLYEYIARHNLVVAPAWLIALTYSALAGFSISTQRAMLMLSIYVVVRLLGREASLLRILTLTAFIILSIDPFSILDGGFWLSFTAVFIISILNLISKELSLWRMQLSLWVGMMPLTSLMFGFVSLVSPLINLIAVPLFSLFIIPVTLLLSISAVTLELDILVSCLGEFSALFEYVIQCLEFLNQHVVMVLFTASSAVMLCVGCFVCFLCLLLRRHLLLMFVLPALYLGVSTDLLPQKDHGFKLWLLDVGQGLSIVYRTQVGVSVYDTGPKYQSGFSAANAVVIPFLQRLGVEKINRLIVSHADNDHIGGASQIMSRFDVGQILTSRVDKFDKASECVAGQTWQEGSTSFVILSPSDLTPSGSNNRSCVLKITHDGVSFLLTGDIEKKVEHQLLNHNVDLSADVLLVPHQGSRTSSTQQFVEAVKPKIGLIAAGYLNHYRHPHDDVVHRYGDLNIKLLSTIEMGTIELGVEQGRIKYSGHRQTHGRPWHWRDTQPSAKVIRKLP